MARKRAASYIGTNLDIVPNETPGTKNEKPFELVGTISKLDSNGEPKSISSRVLLTAADVAAWKSLVIAAADEAGVVPNGDFGRSFLNDNGFSINPVEDRESVLDTLFA